MKKDEKSNEPSLTEKHALDRLNEVEQDKRRAYSKKDEGHSWQMKWDLKSRHFKT